MNMAGGRSWACDFVANATAFSVKNCQRDKINDIQSVQPQDTEICCWMMGLRAGLTSEVPASRQERNLDVGIYQSAPAPYARGALRPHPTSHPHMQPGHSTRAGYKQKRG